MWENYYFFLILREYFGEKNNINIGEGDQKCKNQNKVD